MSLPTRRGTDIEMADEIVKRPMDIVKGPFSGLASAMSFGKEEESVLAGNIRANIDFGLVGASASA